MAKAADVYFQVDPWKVIEQGFDPAYARVSESIFSLGNESIGVRGCFDEGGHVDSLRGAYTNGIYDMEKLSRSYKGIIDKTHFMIPSAEWLMTTISVDGETLDLGQSQFSDFTRELNLRAGTLTRRFLWTTKSGKQIRLTFLRFLDMVHRERAYQRITLEALNFTGSATVTSGVSFDVVHEGRQKCFWQETRIDATPDCLMAQSRTTLSNQEEFCGAWLTWPGESTTFAEGKTVTATANVLLVPGQAVQIDTNNRVRKHQPKSDFCFYLPASDNMSAYFPHNQISRHHSSTVLSFGLAHNTEMPACG